MSKKDQLKQMANCFENLISKKLKKINKNEKIEDKILGTLNYLSPETILYSNTNDGSEDYWALGVMIIFIYLKKSPFESGSIQEILDNITEFRVDWDELKKTKIHPDLFELVQGLLDKDINKRVKSLDQIKNSKFMQSNIFFITIDFDWLNCTVKPSILKKYSNENLIKLNKKIKENYKNKKQPDLKITGNIEEIEIIDKDKELNDKKNTIIRNELSIKIDTLHDKNKCIITEDLQSHIKEKLSEEFLF
jgi:serine/threonine protein kinase